MFAKRQIIINSEYLKSETAVGLVIPAKLDKLMILLHGYNGSFAELYSNLLLSDYVDENNTMIVTPNMNNGYYISKENYQVNDFFSRELLPTVLEKCGLEADIPKYIAGISMGGYGSLLIGSTFASLFQKIISISGAFITRDVSNGNFQIVGTPGDKNVLKYFTDTFAPFDTLECDPCRNPVKNILLCKADVASKVILTCGTEDLLFERNVNVIREFDKNKMTYDWFPIEGGRHNYECFDKGLKYAFEMMKCSCDFTRKREANVIFTHKS